MHWWRHYNQKRPRFSMSEFSAEDQKKLRDFKAKIKSLVGNKARVFFRRDSLENHVELIVRCYKDHPSLGEQEAYYTFSPNLPMSYHLPMAETQIKRGINMFIY